MRSWAYLASRRPVVLRSLRVAAFVGTVLVLINHGDLLFGASLTAGRLARVLLTYAVPYLVSTHASVAATRELLAPARSQTST